MAQFFFFTLFIIAILAGAYAYITPSQNAINQMKILIKDSNSGPDSGPEEDTITTRSQQLNMTTSEGRVQFRRLMDETYQEQKEFIGMINDEQQVLKNAEQEIAELKKQANGHNGIDLLRLKSLESGLVDDQRLMVDQGKALVVLNNQLDKSRQWLADQSDLVDINTQASLSALQERNASLNNQADMYFDNVKQQTNDILQHTQDLIDEERQKSQDQENR